MLTEFWSEIAGIPHVTHVLVPGAYLIFAGLFGTVAMLLFFHRNRSGAK